MKPHIFSLCLLIAAHACAQQDNHTQTGDGWRMIQESVSPDGRFAIAWGEKGKSKPQMQFETYAAVSPHLDIVNYLVDLKYKRILGQTKAKHFGDWSQYNHDSCKTAWSSNSKLVVQTISWKWLSANSDLYQIVDDKKLSSGTDLIEPSSEAAFRKLAGLPQLKKFKQENFSITIEKVSFLAQSHGDSVLVELHGQIPKNDDEDAYFEALVTFALVSGKADEPELKWLDTKLIKEADQN
jgi:hypothetical protein